MGPLGEQSFTCSGPTEISSQLAWRGKPSSSVLAAGVGLASEGVDLLLWSPPGPRKGQPFGSFFFLSHLPFLHLQFADDLIYYLKHAHT